MSGFSVREVDGRLGIADVTVQNWSGLVSDPPLGDEIVAALVQLLDEHPAARRLLGGLTFARTLH